MFCKHARVLVLFVRRTGFKVGWEGLFKNNHAFIGSVCSKRSCHQGSSAFRLCPFKRLRRKISECIGALEQKIVRVRIYMCVCVCGSRREVGSVSVRFKGGGERKLLMINNPFMRVMNKKRHNTPILTGRAGWRIRLGDQRSICRASTLWRW